MQTKIISTVALFIIAVSTFTSSTFAQSKTYTADQVAQHNQTSDCWMIFENKVYNITAELRKHDQYMNIRDWCGRDMTSDFKTKAGEGADHKRSTYNLLNQYYLGDILSTAIPTITAVQNQITPTTNVTETLSTPVPTNSDDSIAPVSKYELWIPLIGTSVTFWVSFFLSRRNHGRTGYSLLNHNLIFNTLMLISLLPSALFGLFMVLRETIPDLYQIQFDFLWWHVEGSIIFTALVFSHFIQRSVQYRAQLKINAKQLSAKVGNQN